VEEKYIKFYSENLSLDIEMLVFGHWGLPVIVFPTTKGKYFESKDFKLIDSVSHLIEAGKVKIYCPDSVDAYSLYNQAIPPAERMKNHIWYDKMILEEVVGAILQDSDLKKVGVAGASFGGYHASNFAFRHPEVVSHLFGMSAAFDIKDQMDGHYDDDVYFNNPVDFLPDASNEHLWKMSIVLGTGEFDICKDANYQMSEILTKKGINHWLDERKGAHHDWPLLREMFSDYLSKI